jgi:hypothetical protein
VLVIYHSRGSLPARQAAAFHMGWLPEVAPGGDAGLQQVYDLLGGAAVLKSEGLWAVGQDRRGRRVCAFGRASRPDVVYRAFHGMADIFGLEKHSFLLQNVGPGVAWQDLQRNALARLGMEAAAHAVEMRTLREGWAQAQAAVAQVAERLAIFEHGLA